jgi:hypothetical protein
VKRWHLVEVGGIYKAWKTPNGYIIESDDGYAVYIKEDEAEEYKGEVMPFMLSDMAKCIKYLERMRIKILMGHYCEKKYGIHTIRHETPIEHYYVNEFPFYSCFCALFRNFKVKGKAPKGVHVCYCPLKPYEHPEWPTTETSYMDGEGEIVDKKRRSCIKYKGKKTGKIFIRSEAKRLQMVEDVSVRTIMKHLKKIKVPKTMKKHLCSLWFHHIKQYVEEWERINKRKFL